MLFSTASIFYRVLTVCMFAISIKLAFVGGGAVPPLCPPAPGTGCCELELGGGSGSGSWANGTASVVAAQTAADTCPSQPASRPSAELATCTCAPHPSRTRGTSACAPVCAAAVRGALSCANSCVKRA